MTEARPSEASRTSDAIERAPAPSEVETAASVAASEGECVREGERARYIKVGRAVENDKEQKGHNFRVHGGGRFIFPELP